MKKVLLFGAFMAILGVSAHAVQKCVALDASVNGIAFEAYSNDSEWNVTFPGGLIVKGIAVCNSTDADYMDTSDSIQLDMVGDPTRCWCRMISPAISAWVYTGASFPGDPYVASDLCGYTCAGFVQSSSEFRAAIFSNLSN